MTKKYIFAILTAIFVPLLMSCSVQDAPDSGGHVVPEGMVEIHPMLPGMFSSIPRNVPDAGNAESRKYDSNDETDIRLDEISTERLPEGSTIWLIAKSSEVGQTTVKYTKKSYVVYNPESDSDMSYLIPCTVDDDGNVVNMESAPLYLKNNTSYLFYALSPARKLDENEFANGNVTFMARNGEYFYASDCRYGNTSPVTETVSQEGSDAVYVVFLKPMINQTAELKFQITRGKGVHDLDIQPSGIEISGLQNDDPDGVSWHMSQTGDEPITLKHGDKHNLYYQYNYSIDSDGNVNIDVPVLPMWSISKPLIVIFHLKVNGVPTSYEMMLNEKDFKAGYSYGYRGSVSIRDGVEVITWQYVSWETDVEFP